VDAIAELSAIILSSKRDVCLTLFLSLRLSRIEASCTDPRSASEVINICNELVGKIEALKKVFVVPERLSEG
jgi:hypothetical protein